MTIDLEQGTDAWLAARLGKVTASRVADVVAKTKTGWGASRANYAAQLITERLTGVVAESYTNGAMQWGTAQEPAARAFYEFHANVDVVTVGFIPHQTIDAAGCSPDGLVGESGLVEIKCPASATHIDTLLSGKVPEKYVTQMQFQMACTGRKWCDFVSFDPRMPASMRVFIKRIDRDDKLIQSLEKDVVEFLDEVETKLSGLTRIYGQHEVLEPAQ